MIKRVFTYVILLILAQNVCSQEILTSLKSDLIAPAPTSAVFRKYMSPQPALSTGAVNIPIPLHELNYKGVKIPFSLCYRTNGITVYSDPCPCGYGWVFMPGLRITRTVMGRPDELFKRRGYKDIAQGGDLYGLSEFDFCKRCITPLDNGITDGNLYDTQYDIFTVNILSGSYTFISDVTSENGSVKFIGVNDNNLIITASADLSTIEVIDEAGTKYYFEIGERLSSVGNYPTSWVLKTITLTNGETIAFDWSYSRHEETQGYEFSSSTIKDSFDPYRRDIFINTSKGEGDVVSNDNADDGNMSPYGRNDDLAHLSKVTYPGGEISLSYKPQSSMLSSINVINSRRENVKSIALTYGENADCYLLKALEISDVGTYRFEYNPLRFTNKNAQDYWGYYNGKVDNLSLIPKMQLKIYTSSLASDTIEGSTRFEEYGKADRSVDETYMQANILTSITYPTGGYSSFEYEAHRFAGHDMIASSEINRGNTPRLTMGGGLRVKKITTSESVGAKPVIKRYEYGIDNNGLANSIAEPTLETFIDVYDSFERSPEYQYGTFACFFRLVYINSASKYMRDRIGETPIWYSQVTEYADEGKTVYKFSHILEECEVETEGKWTQYPGSVSRLFSKGPLLTEQQEYKSNGSGYELTSRIIKEYDIYTSPAVALSNLHVARNIVAYGGCYPDAPDFEYIADGNKVTETCCALKHVKLESTYNFYTSHGFSIELNTEQLKKETVTNYIGSDSVTTVTKYQYYPDRNILSAKTVTLSDGTTKETKYLYPVSCSEQTDPEQRQILEEMASSNIIGTPFRTISINGDATTVLENKYKHYGNRLYLVCQEQMTMGGDSIITRTCDYDDYGNLRSVEFFNGLKETYLWGYNGQYPVFYISGLNFNEVKSIVGEETLNLISNNNLEAARQSLSVALSGYATISAYQYIPLVGLSKITDETGNTYNYSYDKRNRLSQIDQYGAGVRQQFAYNLSDETFCATIVSSDVLDVGDELNAQCNVEDSSGQVDYQWFVTDSVGNDLTTSAHTSSELSGIIFAVGEITLRCVATDVLKQVSSTAVKTIYVNPETIRLSDVSGDNTEHLTAIISCMNPITVRFKVMPDLSSGSCELRIGDTTRQISCGDTDEYIDVRLQADRNRLSVSMSEDASGVVMLALHSVTGIMSERCEYQVVTIIK